MPKFAANLSLMFLDLPYADRFAAAARCGFGAVEVLFPYDDMAATQAGLAATGMDLVLVNAPTPRAGGDLGPAATPGAEAAFRADMQPLLAQAATLGAQQIHIMSGQGDGAGARDAFVSNLRWLVQTAPQQRFTIEPLNPRDRPGYFLQSYDLAADVLDRVGSDRVGLQYDTYHAHLIHGDAMAVWRSHGARASHIQIGNPPDRGEPKAGSDVDFPAFFAAVDAAGYDGWISAEYHPSARTQDTLGWMHWG